MFFWVWMISLAATMLQLPAETGDGGGAGGLPQDGSAAAPRAAAAAAEIAETQLPPYTGQLRRLSAQGLEVAVGGEIRTLPFDRLLRVRTGQTTSPATPRAEIDSGRLQVELADGSLLIADQLTSDGKQVTLAWTAGMSLKFPTRLVSHCLQRSLAPALAPQWQAIVESRIGSDVLVLARTPEALDKIEGLIASIDDKNVQFTFDGQEIAVARTRLAGWRFFTAAAPPRGKLLAVVRDQAGNQWMTAQISADLLAQPSVAKLTLVCGADVEIPAASITEMDFSFGSMRFLADLEPLERKVAPRLALATALPEAEKLFGPQTAAAENQRGAVVGPGVDFLGAGSVTYRIPSDFKRLQGSVLLAADGPQHIPCKVQVFQEDKLLLETTLSQAYQPEVIDLAVEPGRRLRLVVSPEGTAPVGDWVAFRQLRFVK
jgi:hypothetical protein